MDIINQLLKDVPIPRMIEVKQVFPRPKVKNVQEELYVELENKKLLSNIKEGQKIAITAGSRGIANLPIILKEIVKHIKSMGGDPFIVPAMGSHGGATAEGQLSMLNKMGISEEYVGAPIKSSMEVVVIGYTYNGLPVYIDKFANEADGIVIVNRIKVHTSFRGRFESGLMKMLTIGLGKQKGAETCHNLGFGGMAENIPAIGKVIIEKKNIPFAIGIIENAYDETARIVALDKEEIEREEPILLNESKSYMAKINFDNFDVLIIKEIGKNISGTGMDTNVVGRYHTPFASGGPKVTKMAVLDLTDKTQGNANGIGIVDFTTRRVFEKMKFDQTYPNAITSTVPDSVKIPMVLESDRLAISAAIKTCNIKDEDKDKVKLVMIKNTKELDRIFISEGLINEAKDNENIELIGEPGELEFDDNGNIKLFSCMKEG